MSPRDPSAAPSAAGAPAARRPEGSGPRERSGAPDGADPDAGAPSPDGPSLDGPPHGGLLDPITPPGPSDAAEPAVPAEPADDSREAEEDRGQEPAPGDAPRDRRPLALLLAASVISMMGGTLTLVAVPWFVLATTGSAARAGVVAFASAVPVVVAAVLGGPLIDRLGVTASSVCSDAVCALTTAAIPVLHLLGGLTFGRLVALVVLCGLFRAPGDTAREVLVPALAVRAGTSIQRANSAYEGAYRGARMIGAPLAGVLVAVLGAVNLLLLDAGTFAVSAVLVGVGARGAVQRRRSEQPAAGGVRAALAGYRTDLREGFRYLLGARLLFAIVGIVMMTNALDQAWSAVLLPVQARERLGGSVSLGVVTGTFAGAALCGTLLYGVVGHRFSQRTLFIGGFLLAGFPRTLVGAFVPGHLAPLVAVCVLCGLAGGVINPIIGSELVRLVPERLRSRVFGAVSSGVLVAVPLGGLVGGYAVQYAGLTTAMAVVSSIYLLTTLSPLVMPAFRAWDSAGAPAPLDAAPTG
ncbi:MFS transporter [Actinacidiphila yeochonensis]|uniref:MFS transporter n=1 Tax=Actinacidiphila yeochonensis TaxID=89050 RepID=UPI000ACF2E0B|nr:MFS transporter [Actinacidiphila yeochonensis]